MNYKSLKEQTVKSGVNLSGLTQDTRDRFNDFKNHPAIRQYSYDVTSAFRDPEHNAAVGGAESSMHQQGRALDLGFQNHGGFYSGSSSWSKVEAFLKAAYETGFTGYGVGPTQFHIDTRLSGGRTKFKDGREFATWDYSGIGVNARVRRFLISYDRSYEKYEGPTPGERPTLQMRKPTLIQLPKSIPQANTAREPLRLKSQRTEIEPIDTPIQDIPKLNVVKYKATIIPSRLERILNDPKYRAAAGITSGAALAALLAGGFFFAKRFIRNRRERQEIDRLVRNRKAREALESLRRDYPELVDFAKEEGQAAAYFDAVRAGNL